MRKAKQMVAVIVVATAALCADHAIASTGPAQSRPAVADLARQLATKLSANLRRVVPALRMTYPTRDAFSSPCDVRFVDSTSFVSHRWALSPFQFRLPPPFVA